MVTFNCFCIVAIVSLVVYLGLDWYANKNNDDDRKR